MLIGISAAFGNAGDAFAEALADGAAQLTAIKANLNKNKQGGVKYT